MLGQHGAQGVCVFVGGCMKPECLVRMAAGDKAALDGLGHILHEEPAGLSAQHAPSLGGQPDRETGFDRTVVVNLHGRVRQHLLTGRLNPDLSAAPAAAPRGQAARQAGESSGQEAADAHRAAVAGEEPFRQCGRARGDEGPQTAGRCKRVRLD